MGRAGRVLFVLGVGLGAGVLSGCEPPGLDFVVTDAGDGGDAAPGDEVCEATLGAGDCTLRAAVDEANAAGTNDTITIQAGVTPALAAGLDIDGKLTIVGNGAVLAQELRHDGAKLVLTDLVIDGVTSGGCGGAVESTGDVALNGVVVSDSATTGAAVARRGGALCVEGDLSLTSSTLSGNTAAGATAEAGGAAVVGGDLTTVFSTISGNAVTGAPAVGAGGVLVDGAVAVQTSTFSGNTTDSPAGATALAGATSGTVRSATVADSPGTLPLLDLDPSVELATSLLDAGVGQDACAAALDSAGHNLVSDATCTTGGPPSDLVGLDPDLSPLGDHGGATATHDLGVASAARDAIADATPGACDPWTGPDQRERARPVGSGCDIGAVEADPLGATFTVITGIDGVDANPGNGVCATAALVCTLRAAVMEANAHPGAETIVIDPAVGTVELSTAGTEDDAGLTRDLDITGPVAIEGNGTTVRSPESNRVVHVHGGSVLLSDLRIADGQVAFDPLTSSEPTHGGGLLVDGGSVRLRDSIVEHNEAGQGGGIAVLGGSLEVLRSTVIGNFAQATDCDFCPDMEERAAGGGIHVDGGTLTVVRSAVLDNDGYLGPAIGVLSGDATVRQSTISGSTVTRSVTVCPTMGCFSMTFEVGGGAVHAASGATVAVEGSTFTDNDTTAVRVDAGATVTVAGSILDGPEINCTGDVTSLGHNLDTDGGCLDGSVTGDIVGVPARLGARTPDGVHVPANESPARDAVPVGTAGLCDGSVGDQRGSARPAGPACEIGAVEGTSGSIPGAAFVVTRADDLVDGNVGNGVCAVVGGGCTLRAAITEANLIDAPVTITITPGLDPVLTITGAVDDGNARGDLDVVAANLVIEGNGATLTNGAMAERLLHLRDGLVTVRDLTVDGGTQTSLAGGGIFIGNGNVTLERVTVSGSVGLRGGGVAVEGGEVLIVNSTISGNATQSVGGSGGGLSVGGGTTDVVRSTIAANSAQDGAAIYEYGYGQVAVTASVLDGIGTTCAGSVASGGYNVDADGSCVTAPATGDIVGSTLLYALADNGGLSATHLPAAESPAVDRIPAGTAGLCDASSPLDQRGQPRPAGGGCDAGSVEGTGPAVGSPTFVVNVATDAVDANPGNGVCATAAAQCTLRAAVQEANAYPASETITITPGLVPALTILGVSEELAATGDLDIRGDVVIDGAGVTMTAGGLDRMFHVLDGTVVLRDVEITGGANVGGGGAVRQDSGVLTIEGSALVNNHALLTTQPRGGGAVLHDGGELVIRNTTIHGNSNGLTGGAVHSSAPPQEPTRVTIVGSTITGNSITPSNPGASLEGEMRLFGSIVDGPGLDCNSEIESLGYNVTADTTCGDGSVAGDQPSTNALLEPLGDNGGPTPTRLPAANSPVLDVVPVGTAGFCDGTLADDQRGVARPAGAACDAGSVEGASLVAVDPLALVVNVATDAVDATPGDGVCATAAAQCTLRAAVQEANAWVTDDTISFAVGVNPTLSIAGVSEEAGATGDLDIDGDLAIVGGGATVSGANLDRVFDIRNGVVSFSDLVITGGNANVNAIDQGGGGVRVVQGSLDVVGGAITANTTVRYGGGIFVLTGDVTLDGTTVSANSANSGGGGYVESTATATLVDVVVEGNSVPGVGGGFAFEGLADVTGGSFTDNLGQQGAGLLANGGTVDGTLFESNGNGSTSTGGGVYNGGGTLMTLTDVTLLGNTASIGGGLYTNSALALDASLVEGNTASNGAGIAAHGGAMTITDTWVRSNIAGDLNGGGGGLVLSANNTTVTVERSTFSGNQGRYGAAIRIVPASATLHVRNSTISNNTANLIGGAVYQSAGTSTLTFVTMRNNNATGGTGRALAQVAGTMTVSASAFAQASSCSGTVTSGGYNSTTEASCAFAATGDAVIAVPLLAELADNGGATVTNMVLAGSVLLDSIPAGTPGLCDGTFPTDQRGFARPALPATACDRGAVER